MIRLKRRVSLSASGSGSQSITAITRQVLGYDLLNEPDPHFPELKKYNTRAGADLSACDCGNPASGFRTM